MKKVFFTAILAMSIIGWGALAASAQTWSWEVSTPITHNVQEITASPVYDEVYGIDENGTPVVFSTTYTTSGVTQNPGEPPPPPPVGEGEDEFIDESFLYPFNCISGVVPPDGCHGITIDIGALAPSGNLYRFVRFTYPPTGSGLSGNTGDIDAVVRVN